MIQIILAITFCCAIVFIYGMTKDNKKGNDNMSLFNNQSKAQQQNDKIQQAMRRYGVDSLSDPQDQQSIKNIVAALSGSSLMEIGSLIGGSEAVMIRVNAQYSKAIFEQNFIIIRQLERLNRNLEK